MKKFFIIVGVLFLVVCAAAAIFIATFNVDQYRPLIIQKIEGVLGKPVKLDHLGVGWHGGLAIELNKLAVYPDRQAKEALFEIEKIAVVVHLRPLLRKQIDIASILVLQPHIQIIQKKQQTEGSPAASLETTYQAHAPESSAPISSQKESSSDMVPLGWSIAVLEVRDGTVRVIDPTAQPPVDFTIRKLDATVRNLSLTQPVDFQAKAAVLSDVQNLSCEGRVQILSPDKPPHLEKFQLHADLSQMKVSSSGPHLKGKLSVSFEGTFSGKTVTGQGRLQLNEGVIVHLNLFWEIFSKLSIIPGLVEILESRLSDSYKEKLKAEDTVLRPVDLPFIVHNGQLLLNNVQIATDTLELTGTGRVGLDGALAFQVQARVEPQLSAAMVSSVKELQYLTDDQGRLQIPVVVQGTPGRVAVVPDISFVATHLGVNKTEELVGTLLQRFLEKKGKQSGAGS